MVAGISHLTFIVQDLDRMEEILRTILNARKVYDSGKATYSLSKERFFLVGDVWLAIMEGEKQPSKTYNHVAFKIDRSDYNDRLKKIRSLGLDVLDDRSRIEGEAQSIYFYDDDNHLFELHTGTLEERLAAYEKDNGPYLNVNP